MTGSLAAAPSSSSSLLRAGLLIGGLPALAAVGIAAGLAVGVAPAILASAGLFGLAASALAAPLVLHRLVGTRLGRLADALRAARDGRTDAGIIQVHDEDAIGDVARLVGDILAVQADVGRYAAMIRRANALDAAGATLISRMEAGAAALDRTVLQIGNRIGATAHDADRAADLLTAAAERASSAGSAIGRDGGRLAAVAETLGTIARQMHTTLETRHGGDVSAVDAIGGLSTRLAALETHLGGLRAGTSRDLAGLNSAVAAIPSVLADAHARADLALARRFDALAARLDAPRPQVEAKPDFGPIIARLTALDDALASTLVGRLDTLADGLSRLAASPPTVVDLAPVSAGLAVIERRLDGLRAAPPTAAPVMDALKQLSGSVDALSNRLGDELSALQSRAAAATTGGDIDLGRSSLQNLIVAFRLAIRDIADATGSYRHAVADLAAAPSQREEDTAAGDLPAAPLVTELAAKLDRIEATIASAMAQVRPSSPTGGDGEGLGELDLGRSSLQRLLVALRLAIRDVAGETERFSGAVDAAIATGQTIADQFGGAVSRIDEAANGLRERPAAAAALAPEPTLPLISFEREPIAPALIALRSMMRAMAGDAETLHATVERLSSIAIPDNRPSARGDEPLVPLITEVRERIEAGHAVLADLHEQVAQLAAGDVAPIAAGMGDPSSLRQTVSLMGALTAATEARFTEIENRIAEVALRVGGGDSGEAMEALVASLFASAGELRREISEFIAVGAALMQEIRDLGATRGDVTPNPTRQYYRL